MDDYLHTTDDRALSAGRNNTTLETTTGAGAVKPGLLAGCKASRVRGELIPLRHRGCQARATSSETAPGLSSPDYLQARAAESGGNYDPLVLPGSDSPAYDLTNGTGAVKPGATTSPLGRHMTPGATRRL